MTTMTRRTAYEAMLRTYGFLFAVLLTAYMVACTVPGGVKLNGFDERLAAGYAEVTAVRTTTIQLLQAGKISADDAENVQQQCDNVRAGLELAQALHKVSEAEGADKLTATLDVLQVLDQYVRAKQ